MSSKGLDVNEEVQLNAPPVILCFSAHDATGGSGISADTMAISSQGCHAASAITALTVQDTIDVSSLVPITEDILIQSARAVLEDMPVSAFKLGLLPSVEIVEAVHSILYDYKDTPVVYDPVLSSDSGTELIDDETLEAIQSLMLPMTDVLIPNAGEAARLVPEADTHAAMASALLDRGCDHVLLTGTHDKQRHVINVLYHNHREIDRFEWPLLENEFQGSGCTLASTFAALLALGLDPLSAAREAQHFTWHSLRHAYRLGMGQLLPNRLFWVADDE